MSAQSVLAAQLYTVRQFTQTANDLAAALRRVAGIGYRAVQVSGIGPSISPAEVKAITADLGLTICITHIGYDALWHHLDDVIAQHHLWDCRHVAIGSMPEQYRTGEDGFRRFAEEASAVGEKLVAAGLDFSYHNHSFEFVHFGPRTGLDLIYETADPRYLKSEIDTYWVQHGGGDPAAWIRKLAGRAPVVHLKDMVISGGQPIMAEVGEGNLNWPAILDACAAAGVEWYAIEQDECQRDPFESLKISYGNLAAMGLN